MWIQKNRLVGNSTQAEAGWTDDDCCIFASKAIAVLEASDGHSRTVRRNRNLQWALKGGCVSYSRPGEDFRIVCGRDALHGSPDVLPLRATLDDPGNLTLDLTINCLDGITPAKAFFFRGDEGSGLTGIPTPGIEYSWPHVTVSGSLTIEGTTYEVESGSGWIDHQVLMASLQPSSGVPPEAMLPFLSDPRPFIGWCWMFFNLENNTAFTCIALNIFGLSLQLAVPPGSGFYLEMENGGWKSTLLDGKEGVMGISNFELLPTITTWPGPDRPSVLIPSGWGLAKVTNSNWPSAIGGVVTAWSREATFNAEDWSVLSEMPADFVDPSGGFAKGAGFCEAIGYENVLSYQERAVAFLRSGILPGSSGATCPGEKSQLC